MNDIEINMEEIHNLFKLVMMWLDYLMMIETTLIALNFYYEFLSY